MTLILSIDLAYESYTDFGFCLLEESAGKILNIQSHDELSALVAGLAGVAIAGDNASGYTTTQVDVARLSVRGIHCKPQIDMWKA